MDKNYKINGYSPSQVILPPESFEHSSFAHLILGYLIEKLNFVKQT